jgi:hypothetical protein
MLYFNVDLWLRDKIAANKFNNEMKYDRIRSNGVKGQIKLTYTQAAKILFNKSYL